MVHNNLRAFADCQAVNGCAAQHWRQVLMFEGKSRSHFKSFTTNGWSSIDIEHPSSFTPLEMGTEFSQDLYRQGSTRELRLVQPQGQPKLFDERVSCILLFPDHDNIPVPLLVQLMNQYLKRRCFQFSSYETIACLCFSLAGRFLGDCSENGK